MQALHVRAVIEVRCDLLPVLGAELVDKLRQPLVLFLVPVPLVVVRVDLLLWNVCHFIELLLAGALDSEHVADGGNSCRPLHR